MSRRSLVPLVLGAVLTVALGLAFVLLLASESTAASVPLHLALEASVPEADGTVEPPSEIQLRFTQEPQAGSTSIRLIGAEGSLVETGDVVQSEDDVTVFSSAVEVSLPEGPYTVSWRAMAADGHVVAEEFSFTVRRSE